MVILIVLLSITTLTTIALGYATYNSLRKIEFYEQQIEEFYSALSIALHTMRALDTRQMFEDDDDVGTIFKQLSDIVFTLRPLIYGTPDEKEEN